LIDEADILLESRSLEQGDLERNAMVGVFLKILEYYEGVLLLTTNRVKSIDIAVESRIHLAVHFAPMTKDDQRKLFKIFLNRLNEKDIENKEELEVWCDKYFKEEFNGRDIRNMFSSALAIARAENSKLKKRHIEIIKEAKKTSQKRFAEQRTIARAEKGFE
jgi:SpoVK/Ycf46/Vps4 family AAA+-type ATPase